MLNKTGLLFFCFCFVNLILIGNNGGDIKRRQAVMTQKFATHGILIFLDDEETEIRAISNSFLTALIQEAGPIIASASLIVNVRVPGEYDKRDESKFFKRYTEIGIASTPEEMLDSKNIITSVANFNNQTAHNKWIIKEINSSLYLLLPKKYLQSKGISDENIQLFNGQQSAVTLIEQVVGLKVNHMKTVNLGEIEKPEPEPRTADYFIKSLPAIFVAGGEYKAVNKNASIPTWVFYVSGHGLMNEKVVDLFQMSLKTF